eukprot:scaffold64944_cov20-Cyclotella_meneghiniana.AAC.1
MVLLGCWAVFSIEESQLSSAGSQGESSRGLPLDPLFWIGQLRKVPTSWHARLENLPEAYRSITFSESLSFSQ